MLAAKDLIGNGNETSSRNGRVKELLNRQIVISEPQKREILTINRGANVFAQIAETCWILSGRNDVEWLSAYLPRAADYADDGKHWRAGYGPRIRSWGGVEGGLDQLRYVVETLRRDPLSRQAIISIWDPEVDTTPGKDRACNTQLQFQSRLGELHVTVSVRSNDLMWGWSGINAFEWSTLQEIVASLLGVRVGTLTFNIGNLHIYEPHWGKASRMTFEDFEYDRARFNPKYEIKTIEDLDSLLIRWFVWEDKCRRGLAILEDLSTFTDPLFKSWAAAIAYYWLREPDWLQIQEVRGMALAVAIARTPASVLPEPVQRPVAQPLQVNPASALNETSRAFYEYVTDLHAVKHASYGTSWKKRGEKLSILANMARKVDRLGVSDKFDTSSDTWVDLLVYSAKYLCWIHELEDIPDNVNAVLFGALEGSENETMKGEISWKAQSIARDFDYYADTVDDLSRQEKSGFVTGMIRSLAPIARDAWLKEDQYKGADVD